MPKVVLFVISHLYVHYVCRLTVVMEKEKDTPDLAEMVNTDNFL